MAIVILLIIVIFVVRSKGGSPSANAGSSSQEQSQVPSTTAPIAQAKAEAVTDDEADPLDDDPAQPPSRHNTLKFISGVEGQTLAGVQVAGSIGLVCDVSGSMTDDLPDLLRELREKFSCDTPVILVKGCAFQAVSRSDMPTEITHGELERLVTGRASLDDRTNVYLSKSTVAAIIFAAHELSCDTVVFNNDLQDGGSESAIDELRKAYEERGFVLSGRSVEHDAPQKLLDFMQETGGNFVIDPIRRGKKSPVTWTP